MIKYLLLFFLLLIHLNAAIYNLQEKNNKTLLQSLSYFEDVNGTLELEDIFSQKFSQHNSLKNPNFGFTQSTYWFKLSLKNRTDTVEWWATVKYPLLDEVDLYLLEESKILKKVQSGELRDFSTRDIEKRNFMFLLDLEKNREYTIYLRVKSSGVVTLPFTLQTTPSVVETEQKSLIFMGVYYGLFILIVLYNLVLLFYRDDKNYLTYISFISLFVLWQLTLDGLGLQYFWRDNFWMAQKGTLLAMSGSIFLSILFAKYFLRLKKYFPLLDKLIVIFMIYSFLFVIGSFFVPYHIISQANMFNSIVASLVMVILGFIVLQKGYKPALFYLIGWSAFLVGSIIFALTKDALLIDLEVFNYGQQIGSLLEMIFVSWSLADNTRLERQKSLKKQKTFNKNLQKEIDQSIHEARKKDQILIQQSRFAALGEMIEQIAHQWRQPLNTLALINQDIYFKMKLGTFNEEVFEVSHARMNESLQYMSKTIDDFRDFYKAEGKIEDFDIVAAIKSAFSLSEAMLHYAKIQYEIEDSVHYKIHGSKNQFIQILMNLIKNAHDAILANSLDEGFLKVHLFESDERVLLIFEDNAGGIPEHVIDKIFDPYFTTKGSDKGTGIGLYMSKDIIEKTFAGSINVKNGTNGAVFTLVIPLVDS